MANTASARKAIRVSDRKRIVNDRLRKTLRKAIKEIKDLSREKKMKEAKALLPNAYKAIDKAAKRGVIKQNTASRKKAYVSRISKAS
jgi:small subunit ribosomal protein S20